MDQLDADTIDHRYTVEDPATYAGPWTAALPMTRLDGPIYEYACHEGNYGMENLLRGARVQEGAAVAPSTGEMSGPGVDQITVPVTGGDLFVARWGSGPPVLAVHGITGSHAAWPWVADKLAGAISLIAPDLRGRGASNGLPGPFGMAAHAADLVAVLDHLELTRAVVVGHSMGAWIAATLAARYPERVSSLLLVDGGLPQTLPEGIDIETHAAAVLGPALSRLERTFPSETAYLEFWRAHPAFAAPGAWDAHLERYVRWDLGGEAPALRPRASRAAATADFRDILGPAGLDCLHVRAPVLLLRAPRGLLNQPEPFLSLTSVTTHLPTIPGARHEVVEGTNHYTIVMGVGAGVVAERILEAVQGR